MKTIKLKKLKLFNFKGTRDLEIDFNQTTNIYGDNATGKTTVFDSFTWLLFGKDSTDRKQFEIKTLDQYNRVIPKIDHEVTAVLEVGGEDIEIKRVLKEKWVKKKGALEAEFSGNETLYYWNDVPLQAKEFQGKINDLIDEGVFKLITNPLYFNGLKWQERREVLIRIVGSITNDDLAKGNDKFIKLITGLRDKTIEEYKREISARKKKLNTDLKLIPARIDEASRALPEASDFDGIRVQIKDQEEELNAVEESLLDSSKALKQAQEKHAKIQQEIFDCKSKIQSIEFTQHQELKAADDQKKAALNGLKRQLQLKRDEQLSVVKDIDRLGERKGALNLKKESLRDKWRELNAEQISFNEDDFCCPTCKRKFDDADIDVKKKTLTENFQTNKAQRLTAIQNEGRQYAGDITKIETEIQSLNQRKEVLKQEVDDLRQKIASEEEKLSLSADTDSIASVLSKREDYNNLKAKISALEAQTIKTPQVDTSELQKRKSELNSELNTLRALLNNEAIIKKGKQRIEQLEEEERNLAQQISELEGTEFTINAFIKTKIETLENRINSKFKLVKFKLFDTQINGGEVECCETLLKGVPFTDLNSAARINAGLDIINALCEFHKVSAPIFIDNRESVNELIELHSQIVNLIVSRDLKLKIA